MKVNNKVMKGFRFVRYCKYKRTCLLALAYSTIYRIGIMILPPKTLHKHWGNEGEESAMEDTMEHYVYAHAVSYAVDHICNRTPWESKCLVRALTAQKLLRRKRIHSTLYLGCGLKDDKMVAHAWLRAGAFYVTGGNGEDYTIVDKYAT